MKLFVYEHITSGALASQALPTRLAEEGDAMLIAIVQDLSEIPQLEITLLRDYRLAPMVNHTDNIPLQYYWVNNAKQFSHQWQQCLAETELVFVIAPETEQQLTLLQQDILDHDKFYLGCSQQSTSICSDKLLCYQHLSAHKLPTPNTVNAALWMIEKNIHTTTKFIVKPFDGAGCLDTLLFESSQSVQLYLATLSADKLALQVVQPYISGKPISLCLFISNNEIILLSINTQNIDHQTQHLIFKNSTVNTLSETEFSRLKAQKIAEDICDAIPGLWGFVGIDLVLSSSGPVIIEVNPRMTSSYIHLKETVSFNPATLLIEKMHELTNKKLVFL
ncbi:MAG: hypothetical protein COB23_04660 [Methylophaga sp.]|nr:MAG: hypothetical protein COB23_04660 [Methylophaga sp.]